MPEHSLNLALAASAGLAAGFALATRCGRSRRYQRGNVSLCLGKPEHFRALGEGATWDHAQQRLLWIDIIRCKIFVYHPKTGENREVDVRQYPGTIVLRRDQPDHVIAALHRGIGVVDISAGHDAGKVVQWLGYPREEQDNYTARFNDGKCDPAGRFWVGTMDLSCDAGKGALYCVQGHASHANIQCKVRPANIPNGIVWNRKGDTMYWIDTSQEPLRIDAFDYDLQSGTISNRRIAVNTGDRGYPDGCAIDEDDNIWVAKWAGWCVECYDPRANKLLHRIELPVEQVTSCTFGGEQLDQLYITTAYCGLSAEAKRQQPLAGGLFVADLSGLAIKGMPAYSYSG